ncbi:MAG: fimbrillin family protein [Treponema sp.]|jgi:hypothetical protein|nr:fimbrillin family protein [Treponema sp.]
MENAHRDQKGPAGGRGRLCFSIPLVLALALACPLDKSAGGGTGGTAEVRFIAAGIDRARPRTAVDAAGDAVFAAGDRIGVYMLPLDGAFPGALLRENAEYRADGGAAFTNASGSPLVFPGGGADFTAYYPYRETVTGYQIPVDVTDQSLPAAIDLLYSDNARNQNANPVDLRFVHALSKLTLLVRFGAGIPGGAACSGAELGGMPARAKLSLADGSILDAAEAGPISARQAPVRVGYNAAYEALLIPQPDGGGGRSAAFTVAGETYRWNIPDGTAFLPGSGYTYEITIRKTGITVDAGGIALWDAGDGADGPLEAAPPLLVLSGPAAGTEVAIGFTSGASRTERLDVAGGIPRIPSDEGLIIRSIQASGLNSGDEILIGRKTGAAVSLRFSGGALVFRDPEDGMIPIGSYAEFQLINQDGASLGGSYKQEPIWTCWAIRRSGRRWEAPPPGLPVRMTARAGRLTTSL